MFPSARTRTTAKSKQCPSAAAAGRTVKRAQWMENAYQRSASDEPPPVMWPALSCGQNGCLGADTFYFLDKEVHLSGMHWARNLGTPHPTSHLCVGCHSQCIARWGHWPQGFAGTVVDRSWPSQAPTFWGPKGAVPLVVDRSLSGGWVCPRDRGTFWDRRRPRPKRGQTSPPIPAAPQTPQTSVPALVGEAGGLAIPPPPPPLGPHWPSSVQCYP